MTKDQQKQWRKENYAKNRETILARNAQWESENREARLSYFKKYNATPSRIASSRKWSRDHKEQRNSKSRVARSMEKEKWREHWRQYRKANPDTYRKYYARAKTKKLAQFKVWASKNRDHLREYSREFFKKNPHLRKLRNDRRRLLRHAASINLAGIKEFLQRVETLKSVPCYYCGTPTHKGFRHYDHIVALSRGGEHSAGNLCVACPPCNCSKQAKSVQAFIKVGQQFLSL